MARTAAATLCRIGQTTVSATSATDVSRPVPSRRIITGTTAAPGRVAATSSVGVSRRSAAGEAPSRTPSAVPASMAQTQREPVGQQG